MKTKKPYTLPTVGPNGFRTGYLPNGDFVEWIKEGDEEYPMILRRNEKDIDKVCEECFEKVWWNRHQSWLAAIESGAEPLTKGQKPILEEAKRQGARIQRKYGRKNLVMSDFEFGVLHGKLSALRWVCGSEWEGSMDT